VNSKISALTSATTPLVGTETLPIVQGGVTVKTTVANITNGGGYAGSFTTLASTGDATLGDATTDTVTVNGYMGVGGAGTANVGIRIRGTALTGATQVGAYSTFTASSAATASVWGFLTAPATAATAFTATNMAGFSAADVTKGAGSTITNQHGVYISDQTQGTNNFGVTSLVSSGTNKWNIYASGTAQNGFTGNVRIGSVVAPTVALDVTGAVKVSTTITPLDNVVQGTAAKGVNFTANTPAAGMTSQLLNWYEEGTWTPSIGGTATYTTQNGRYTRIGRVVYFEFQLQILLILTGSTTTVTGLPFTAANNSAFGGHAIYYASLASSITTLIGYVGTTNIVLQSSTAAQTSVGSNAIFKDSANVIFQGFYFV